MTTPNERLAALEAELACGEARLARLDAEREALLHQMLRIEGAILLLRELTTDDLPATRCGNRQDGGANGNKN